MLKKYGYFALYAFVPLLAVALAGFLTITGDQTASGSDEPKELKMTLSPANPWAEPKNTGQRSAGQRSAGQRSAEKVTLADVDFPSSYVIITVQIPRRFEKYTVEMRMLLPDGTFTEWFMAHEQRRLEYLHWVIVDNLVPYQDYEFRAVAYPPGDGPPSTVVEPLNTPPTAPLAVFGHAEGVRYIVETDDPPLNADNIRILRAPAPADPEDFQIIRILTQLAGERKEYMDRGAVPGRYYEYRMEALGPPDEHGDQPVEFAPQVLTTRAGLYEPSEPTSVIVEPQDGLEGYQVSWSSPEQHPRYVAFYEILRRDLDVPGSQYKVVGVTIPREFPNAFERQGGAYRYAVRTVDWENTRSHLSELHTVDHGGIEVQCDTFKGQSPVSQFRSQPLHDGYAYELQVVAEVRTNDGRFQPCRNLDDADWLVERRFEYKHVIDPACPMNGMGTERLSCDLIGQWSDDGRFGGPQVPPSSVDPEVRNATLEVVNDQAGRSTITIVDDPIEGYGWYRPQWRICYLDNRERCSEWSGYLQIIGPSSMPFTQSFIDNREKVYMPEMRPE